MTRDNPIRRPDRADYRTGPSPFGDHALRDEWTRRIASFSSLAEAVSALLSWREASATAPLRSADGLWVEARLEDSVAVKRFEELSFAAIREQTLTGQSIAALEASFLERAHAATAASTLEDLAGELRQRFKPPVMPTSPYMRIEIALSQALIKRRSLNWFDTPLEALRAQRQAAAVTLGDDSLPTSISTFLHSLSND